MRVLVVDDFATLRRVLRGQLRAIGIDAVSEAADGIAALESLRAESFDLVVTDIGMPGMSGFELLHAVKRDEALRRIPVLMVTAEAKRDDIVRCAQEGAAGYIVKPFSRDVLEAKLRRIVPRAFARDGDEQVAAATAVTAAAPVQG